MFLLESLKVEGQTQNTISLLRRTMLSTFVTIPREWNRLKLDFSLHFTSFCDLFLLNKTKVMEVKDYLKTPKLVG